jgi:putative transposase
MHQIIWWKQTAIMELKNGKSFYKRNLPHLQPAGGTFFVTFRLYGSLPVIKLQQLREKFHAREKSILGLSKEIRTVRLVKVKQEFFFAFDALLDKIDAGPLYLRNPKVAQIVVDQLQKFDGELYHLIAYCIMPNHVHLLIDTLPQNSAISGEEDGRNLELPSLQEIMKKIKGPTAIYCNRELKRKGKFWQRESYDRLIRNEKEMDNTIAYILDNPVKAGLVKRWSDYRWSYIDPRLIRQ